MWKNYLLFASLLLCSALQALPEARTLPRKDKDQQVIGHLQQYGTLTLGEAVFYGKNIPINDQETFLEVGSRTGVISLLTTYRGAAYALACDMHPQALDLIHHDILNLNLSGKLAAIRESAWDYLSPDKQFDVIFLNEGYFSSENLASFRSYLKPTGRLLIGASSPSGDFTSYAAPGWDFRVIATHS